MISLIIPRRRVEGWTMKRGLLGLFVVAMATAGAPRSASADETDASGLFFVSAFGVADAGLAITDLAAAVNRKWLSRVYGGFETVVAGTQTALCLDALLKSQGNNGNGASNGNGWFEIGAGLGAVLLAHGIVTLVGPGSSPEAPASPGPVMVAPVALSDVARNTVGGVAVLGRF
jgi:hypothetical protein